jgi:hypothetical protein
MLQIDLQENRQRQRLWKVEVNTDEFVGNGEFVL